MASEQEWSEAILSAKVRIGEIERELQRPPVKGEFPNWRKQRIREKLVLEQKVADIERILSRELERSKSGRTKGRGTRPKPPCFLVAVKLLKKNPNLTLKDFYLAMDSKAEQYRTANKYKPPEKWKVRSFREQYEKRPNTVSRFLSAVRKYLRTHSEG